MIDTMGSAAIRAASEAEADSIRHERPVAVPGREACNLYETGQVRGSADDVLERVADGIRTRDIQIHNLVP